MGRRESESFSFFYLGGESLQAVGAFRRFA